MSCSSHDKKNLFELLKRLSFRFGQFTLASGKKASYYVDCRKTTLDGQGAYLSGRLLYEKIAALQADAVGGMSLGADPIVSAVICRSAEAGHPMKGFLVRKEAKGHGTGRQVEGHLEPWMRVVLVEDVVTTGGSVIKTIEAIKRTCPTVQIVKILALVDREEGGKETFEKLAIPFESLYSVREFLQG